MAEKDREKLTEDVISSVSSNDDKYSKRAVVLKFIDEHIRETKWTLYGIGGLGALLVLRNIYAVRRFVKPDDIPVKFIEKNVSLQGKVTSIGHQLISTSSNRKLPILWTLHEPIVNLPFKKWDRNINNNDVRAGCLPIGLAGIAASPTTLKWLNENVKSKHIWFKILGQTDNRIDAIVRYRQGMRKISINKHVVIQGIGKVYDFKQFPKTTLYQNFIDELIKFESRAATKGIGMWRDEKSSLIKRTLSYSYYLLKLPFRLFKRKKKD